MGCSISLLSLISERGNLLVIFHSFIHSFHPFLFLSMANDPPDARTMQASVHNMQLRKRLPQQPNENQVIFHPIPRGRVPEGKLWDEIYGEWIEMPPNKVIKKAPQIPKRNQERASPLSAQWNRPLHRGVANVPAVITPKSSTRINMTVGNNTATSPLCSTYFWNAPVTMSSRKTLGTRLEESSSRTPIIGKITNDIKRLHKLLGKGDSLARVRAGHQNARNCPFEDVMH